MAVGTGPQFSNLSARPALARESASYVSQRQFLISSKFPTIKTDKIAGKFGSWAADLGLNYDNEGDASTAAFATVASLMGTESAGYPTIGADHSFTNYDCKKYGYEKFISDVAQREHDGNLAQVFSNAAMEKLLIDRDILLAAQLFATGNWTNSAPTVKWLAATSDSQLDIELARASCRVPRSMLTVVLGAEVVKALRTGPEINDVTKYVSGVAATIGSDEVLASALAAYWGVKEVIFFMGQHNSANKGQTVVGADIGGDFAWVGVLGAGNDPNTAIAIAEYQAPMIWQGRDPKDEGLTVRANMYQDIVLPQSQLGYLLTAVATA